MCTLLLRARYFKQHLTYTATLCRTGFIIGHVTPEAQLGGPLALVKNGDKIVIGVYGRHRSVFWPHRLMESFVAP